MKKLVCMLAIVGIAAPLFADSHVDPNQIVVFDLARVDGNKVVISYEVQHKDTGAPLAGAANPVAIGLLATITGATPGPGIDAEIMAYEDVSSEFEVYPDAIFDIPEPNRPEYRIGMGSPMGLVGAPGTADVGMGNGVSSAAVCMGRLQGNFVGEPGAVEGPNPGPGSDQLITLVYRGKDMVDVEISADTFRGGGAVGSELATNLPQTITVWACWGCAGQEEADINGDGVVDPLDALRFGNSWAAKPGDAHWDACADLNRDGVVDPLDALIFGNNWAMEKPVCP
jgi:hypothetical protein